MEITQVSQVVYLREDHQEKELRSTVPGLFLIYSTSYEGVLFRGDKINEAHANHENDNHNAHLIL